MIRPKGKPRPPGGVTTLSRPQASEMEDSRGIARHSRQSRELGMGFSTYEHGVISVMNSRLFIRSVHQLP